MNENLKNCIYGYGISAASWATGALTALHSDTLLAPIPEWLLTMLLIGLHFPMIVGMVLGSLSLAFYLSERGRDE